MRISKQEYIAIQLYAKGLTFRGIAEGMEITEPTAKTYFMRVKKKDKSRVTRAKMSRVHNKKVLADLISLGLDQMENMRYCNETYSTKHIILDNKSVKELLTYKYIQESVLFAYRSYNRFIVNLKKKSEKNGAGLE